MTDKLREKHIRRTALRHGLKLIKSRRRDPRTADYGNYWLIEPSQNRLVFGQYHGSSLDDIGAWLDR
jgi:hypothetical protein